MTARATFNPDKVNILSKTCRVSGRLVSCFNTTVCFSATFRPKIPVGPVGKPCFPASIYLSLILLLFHFLSLPLSTVTVISVAPFSITGASHIIAMVLAPSNCVLLPLLRLTSALRYNLTLDADLQSSRVTSRGQFSNSERVLQKDIRVSTRELCDTYEVFVQVKIDNMK